MSKSVINLPAPFGGMNNVLPDDKVGNNQAVLIENVEYDDNLKTFKGSNQFKDLTYNYGKFNKLYEVIIDNSKHLIITHDSGYFDVTLNKNFPLGINIDNVVGNEDGLYFSSGSKVYEYKDGVLKEIYSQTFKPSSSLEILDFQVSSIAYYNGELYFTSGNSVYIRYYDEVEEKHKIKLFFTVPDNTNNMQAYIFVYDGKLYILSYFDFRVENNSNGLNNHISIHKLFHTNTDTIFYNGVFNSFHDINFNGNKTYEYISLSEAIKKVLNEYMAYLYVFENNIFIKADSNNFANNYCASRSLNSSTNHLLEKEKVEEVEEVEYNLIVLARNETDKELSKVFHFSGTIFPSFYNSKPIVLNQKSSTGNFYIYKDIENNDVSSYIPQLIDSTSSSQYYYKTYIFDIMHPLGKTYKVYFVLKFQYTTVFIGHIFNILLDVLYYESDGNYKFLLENYPLKELHFVYKSHNGRQIHLPTYFMNNDYVNIIKVSDYEFIIVKDRNFIYCSFFKNLSSTDIVFKYNNITDNAIDKTYNEYYVSTYSEEEKTIYFVDNNTRLLNKFSTSLFSKKIPFLLIHNGRLIVPNEKSLYFSAVGDFSNFSYGTDADGLYLEIGYKDGGNLIAGAISYGNIILFKDNGYIYRLSGDYPNWVLTKIAETDNITSNIFNYNGTLLFGTKTGIKQLNPSQNYGDFSISDFQNNIISDNVTHISLSENRKALIFCSENYVIEYSLLLNIFYIYQSKVYKEILEYYDKEKKYTEYAVDSVGKVYNNNTDEKNIITIKRGLISNQKNIVIKSITLFTDELKEDEEITIYLHGDINFKRVLKQGQSKHKIFLTKRLLEMQLKYIHTGDIFINNIIVECDLIGV